MPAAAPILSPPQATPLPSDTLRAGNTMLRCLTAFSREIEQAKTKVREGAGLLTKNYSHVPFDPARIVDNLASRLPQQILTMAARVMVLELNVARLEGKLAGNTPEERFASFVDRLSDQSFVASLVSEYPVLVEQVVNRLERWAEFSLEFLRHLCEDWASLRLFFDADPGQVTAINAGEGDTHRGGRSVMIAAFSSGSKLVYKPRSLAVDEHFQQLLAWLNDRGVSPQFRITQIVNRCDHGWSEFISAGGCRTEAEVQRFYERQGGYLAILYVLNATDFHYENLIAAGEDPVLIDLEALFHPRDVKFTGPRDPGTKGLWESVVSSGLLPFRLYSNQGSAGLDVSGLTNPVGQLSPSHSPVLENPGTDEIHVVRRRLEMTAGQNCPKLDGDELRALDYAQSIDSGFSSTYRLLLQNRAALADFLERFAEDEVRFIARGTQTYGTLLFESFHPDLLRDAAERLALFERLREATAHEPWLEDLVASEIKDLLAGDIPVFRSRPSSRHIWTSDGECRPNFLPERPLALAKLRLRDLNEDDLERQLWIIRASLVTVSPESEQFKLHRSMPPSRPASTGSALSTDQLISSAMAVGDRLAQLVHREGDGANWIGLASLKEHRRQLSPLAMDLYDGLPGVILFLGYLSSVTGEARYKDLAYRGLKVFQSSLDAADTSWRGIGGYSGSGGVIYALCHLSSLFADPTLAAMAESALKGARDAIASDSGLDVIAGSAGFALALQSLRKLRPSVDVTELQRACGERLLLTARQSDHGLGWISLDSAVPLTGFAHGNAGIAYALLCVADATNDDRFLETARSAIAYERAVFSTEEANWPDLRAQSDDGYGIAWCHGAPGIGLARLCSLSALDDPLLRAEVDVALRTTVAKGFGNTHIVCHGDLGNVDILLHAAEILGESRWKEHAHEQTARILNTSGGGNWRFENALNVDTPGFMTGLAGIGYVLLRLAAPSRVPCVLALEPQTAK
jgi:type 2 lantibiotic biosynthesis protein LanM